MATDVPVRVITGASAGIGRALARRLAVAGPVALVARDRDKADSARSEILSAVPDAMVEVYVADLCTQSEVRSLATQLSAVHPRIAALVNVAGVFSSQRVETANGQFFHKGKAIDPPKYTRDVDEQHRLWQVSEQLTGLA
jgi:short-subunit dehydrogenase